MTHTLHRVGEPGSLERDYVLLFMPSKDINHVDSGPKLRRMLEISLKCGAIKIGDCRKGNEYHQNGLDKVLENVEDRAVVTTVFDDPDNVVQALKELKEADLGISVVVSGLFDKVRECCREAELTPHTVNNTLGRWGRTDRLPSKEILEINTMCGHGMVAVKLIEEMAARVKSGEISPEVGAEQLFKPCMCGIFNVARAAELLKAMAGERKIAVNS
ncbi:MAG: hypothetical protein AAGU11_01800 [Syntrophobacteraceae bacterium]